MDVRVYMCVYVDAYHASVHPRGLIHNTEKSYLIEEERNRICSQMWTQDAKRSAARQQSHTKCTGYILYSDLTIIWIKDLHYRTHVSDFIKHREWESEREKTRNAQERKYICTIISWYCNFLQSGISSLNEWLESFHTHTHTQVNEE